MTDNKPIEITVTPTLSRVESKDDWILDLLESYLSFDDEANQFIMMRGQLRRRTDSPKLRLFNLIDRTFPTGLLGMVCKELKNFDIPFTIKSTSPSYELTEHPMEWLRDYQREAVDTAIAKKRGILWLPTGSGKTECAIAISLRVKTPWLFIVHKKDLLHQTAERYELRTGEKAGKIGDGHFDIKPFTVATFQTLSKGLKQGKKEIRDFLQSIGGVFHDECHVAAANSSVAVMMACPNATYRFGLSGTPLARGDKRSIFAVGTIGPVIHRIHPDTLIAAGVLSRPRIHMFKLTQESDKTTWQGVYGEAVVRSTKRNKILTNCATICEKPALLFVKEIKHGHELQKRLTKRGIGCDFVWGAKDSGKRDAAVKRLVTGDIDVLIVSVIFQEGTDIPSIRSLIIGSSGKSAIAAIQRVGRGMRMHDGEKEFFVYDVYDQGHRTLKKWSRERKAAYEAEGYDVSIIDE